MKRSIASAKNFVHTHKTAIAVATTATLCIAMQMRTMKVHNEFLMEHGLFEEFYNSEEE